MTKRHRIAVAAMLAYGLCLLPVPARAQNHFTLEMTAPLPCDGVAEPNGADTGARHCRAYPALEYNVQVACIGGTFPYTYSLSGEPAWLTIASTTGILSGTPTDTTTDDDASITVICTDAVSATANRTFGIDVTTTGFFFVDKVSGTYRTGNGGCVSSCGTGTLANPWKDLEDVYDGTTDDQDIVYFRGCSGCGTGANSWSYTTDNILLNAQDDVNGEEEIQWGNSGTHAQIWIAYPGETPRIDYAYTGDGCGNPTSPTYGCGQSQPRIETGSAALYMDGLQLYRCMTMCFEVNRTSGRGAVFRRMTFMSSGPGINGGNSSMLTWERSSAHMTYGDLVIDNTMIGSGLTCGSTNGFVKTYDTHKMLIARNTLTGDVVGSSCDALFALKGGPWKTFVRENVITSLSASATWIGGNWAESDAPLNQQFSAEISYNTCLSTLTTTFGKGCLMAQASPADFIEAYVFRNTFYGLMTLANFDASGPFEFRDNIVINEDTTGTWPRIQECCNGVSTGVVYGTDATTADGNLLGGAADSIVNSTTGELQGVYLTSYGPITGNPKGAQLSASAPSPPPSMRLRLQGGEEAALFLLPLPLLVWRISTRRRSSV